MKRFGSIPIPAAPSFRPSLVYVAFGTFGEGRYIRFPQGTHCLHPRTLLIAYPDGSAGRVMDYSGPGSGPAIPAERFPAGSEMAEKIKAQFQIFHPLGLP